jgi:hypothetical protein
VTRTERAIHDDRDGLAEKQQSVGDGMMIHSYASKPIENIASKSWRE